jgi:hypothetical protein
MLECGRIIAACRGGFDAGRLQVVWATNRLYAAVVTMKAGGTGSFTAAI